MYSTFYKLLMRNVRASAWIIKHVCTRVDNPRAERMKFRKSIVLTVLLYTLCHLVNLLFKN